jgi:cyclomaltodextrinase / maltogenic alpha-amylase / neopullulanase
MKTLIVFSLAVAFTFTAAAQTADSVDVKFYYTTQSNPTAVYLPGEFNDWGHNVSGVIPSGDPSAMTKSVMPGLWTKVVRLRVGGGIGAEIPGSYQYKINENGNTWLSDPLNPLENLSDNNNSIIYITNPTIFLLTPNQKSGIVAQQHPTISAYIFPAVGYSVDTTSITITIDTASYLAPSGAFSKITDLVSFNPPNPLDNGLRRITLSAKNFGGLLVSDSASFTVLAGPIQILNQSGYSTVKDSFLVNCSVEDTTIHSAIFIHNTTDSQVVTITGGAFSENVGLTEGLNTFRAITHDSTGSLIVSSIYTITRIVNHAPSAVENFSLNGSVITLSAAQSTDPDSGQTSALTYAWSVDPNNPEAVAGVDGSVASSLDIQAPKTPGEYYFGLIAADPDGNKDTTRSYFTVDKDGSVIFPALKSNPQWFTMGRIYEMFFNSFTPQQTINAATQKLDYLQKLGVNILWVMPVMKNNQPIDNGPGPGYNIVDFYTVAPQYGTAADFKNFVQQAHLRGMKVILDVTPNHTSSDHPFVEDARLYRTNSFYWNFYEHQLITNPNYKPELSEAITNDGFVYYGAFSDEILNYNWADLDARAYMIGVYTWWVKEMGLDGYRFDVYWGPHSRADGGNGGENEMGLPVRTAIKHIKPDVFLLGETFATGIGTETSYADDNGGLDAAYDWNLLHNVIQPYVISAMNDNVTNYGGDTMGFVPGPDSRFMRFLENHDEDRIAYTYGSYAKTMPMGTMIFTVPGIPMIYSGQEVGFGLGISDFDQRRRGIIDWSSAGEPLLTPHYQRLAWIRATYPAFSTLTFHHLSAGNSDVYAYTRPFADQNGIAIENFNGFSIPATININGTGTNPDVLISGGAINGKTYYLNDVYNDTSYAVSFKSGTLSFSTALPAYGSEVFILSDSVIHLSVPSLTDVSDNIQKQVPLLFSLQQNFPNPFNPVTVIQYSVSSDSKVSLQVYDVLGREVAVLVDGEKKAGSYAAEFDGKTLSSGVYYYRLVTKNNVEVKRMVLLK